MDSAIVITGTEKGLDGFILLMKQSGFSDIKTAIGGNEGRRALLERDYDVVVINSPLGDEYGHEIALMVTENSTSGVIILSKNEIMDEVTAKVEQYGVIVIGKPLSKQSFYQAIHFVTASRNRMLGLKKENARLHQKIDEIKLVDRAKCVLIQYLGLTEPQAHRYIEKQAMDRRISRKEIAENVLKTYEN